MAQNRKWIFTINNYNELEEKQLKELKYTYILYSREIGESGTPHIQGFLYNNQKLSRRQISKVLPRAYLEPAIGTIEDQKSYIIGPYEKDGKYKPYNPDHIIIGEEPAQGKRKDLDAIKQEITEGKTVDNITEENPILYHQYGRTLNKLEDLYLRKQFRTEMTTCDWIYGATGTGKSHEAFKDYDPETHYVYPNDNGWWDGYKQQETVIINEFRGGISYAELLELIDKWPKTVKRRNREPIPFTTKHIIITSSKEPHEVYNNLSQSDSLQQLYRRITIIKKI